MFEWMVNRNHLKNFISEVLHIYKGQSVQQKCYVYRLQKQISTLRPNMTCTGPMKIYKQYVKNKYATTSSMSRGLTGEIRCNVTRPCLPIYEISLTLPDKAKQLTTNFFTQLLRINTDSSAIRNAVVKILKILLCYNSMWMRHIKTHLLQQLVSCNNINLSVKKQSKQKLTH